VFKTDDWKVAAVEMVRHFEMHFRPQSGAFYKCVILLSASSQYASTFYDGKIR